MIVKNKNMRKWYIYLKKFIKWKTGGNLKPTAKSNFLNSQTLKSRRRMSTIVKVSLKKTKSREFPGGLMVATWHFHCWGSGSILGQGTKINPISHRARSKTKTPKSKTTMQHINLTSGYTSQKSKHINPNRCMHPNVHSNMMYTCQDTETT